MQNFYNKKIMILSLAFFLFSCLAFEFIYKEINSNNKIITDSLVELEKENLKSRDLQTVGKLVKTIENDKNSLETHFVQSSEIAPFLDALKKIPLEVGASGEIISANVLKDGTGVIVEMKISGTFKVVYKSLMLLENSSYQLKFNLVDMQKSNTINSKLKNNQWEAFLKIKLLSFIQ